MDLSPGHAQPSRTGGLARGPAPIRYLPSSYDQPRPASMILSSPSLSHAPGSIYPDTPSQNTHLRTNLTSRMDPSRRHTTYLATSPRREGRPLRSSPLAGPSIGHDGTLNGSEESASSASNEERPKYRPSRISSSPDVTIAFKRPTSLYDLPPELDPEIVTPPPIPQTDAPSPTEPERPEPVKRSRRLSWGFVKLAPLPALPTRSASTRSSKKLPLPRTSTPPPPVPEIPVWALPSSPHFKPSSPSTASLSSRRSEPSPNSPSAARRPSTAPGTIHPNRQAVYLGHTTGPSTSRDPELNWLSTAAPPKFSRLSLKADGVILPVSAKEAHKIAKRRSTATISPSTPLSLDNKAEFKDDVKGKGRELKSRSMSRLPSQASLASLASMASDNTVPVPAPPFSTASRNNSLSSLASASSLNAPTPSLTLSRTNSVGSATDLDEMGVLSGLETALGSRAANGGFQKAVVGVEVRVNDVCVDVISTSSETKSHGVGAASVAVPELPQDTPGVQRSATGKLHRGKGTIKRIWKRVVGTVKH